MEKILIRYIKQALVSCVYLCFLGLCGCCPGLVQVMKSMGVPRHHVVLTLRETADESREGFKAFQLCASCSNGDARELFSPNNIMLFVCVRYPDGSKKVFNANGITFSPAGNGNYTYYPLEEIASDELSEWYETKYKSFYGSNLKGRLKPMHTVYLPLSELKGNGVYRTFCETRLTFGDMSLWKLKSNEVECQNQATSKLDLRLKTARP